MHAFRLRACLLPIVMVLVLSACASASVSEAPEMRASHIINANAMSKALPEEKVDSALNPVRLIIPAIDINASV